MSIFDEADQAIYDALTEAVDRAKKDFEEQGFGCCIRDVYRDNNIYYISDLPQDLVGRPISQAVKDKIVDYNSDYGYDDLEKLKAMAPRIRVRLFKEKGSPRGS